MKPQRRSPRLKDYDYTQSGAYFVTICTHERQRLFGYVTEEGDMILSNEGRIATSCWHNIPDHFPLVELDVFVVMPNHVHGILVFSNGHGNAVSLRGNAESFGKPVAGSLSTVVRSYKSIVTRTIHEISTNEVAIWQGRFHDHIIRSEASLNHIRQYVINNPALWHKDKFYIP